MVTVSDEATVATGETAGAWVLVSSAATEASGDSRHGLKQRAPGLAGFITGLASIVDRDLVVPGSGEVVLARALRELAL